MEEETGSCSDGRGHGQYQTTGATKSQTVIILEDIDYASGGGGKKEGQNQQNGSATPATPAADTNTAPENSPNFEGYSNFGGGSFFDGNF